MIMEKLSSVFSRPMLIYDDKCYACKKFASYASTLSRGWIRLAGHYYSQEAINAKKMIFPAYYDSTKMFWLINEKGAYGARSGLLPVAREIIKGIFKRRGVEDQMNLVMTCNYDEKLSCASGMNTLKRIVNMMLNSSQLHFQN